MAPQKLVIIGIALIGTLLLVAQILTGNPAYITGPGFNQQCKIGNRTNINEWKYMEVSGVETHAIQGKKINMCCANIIETNLLKGGGIESAGKFCEGKKDNTTCKILLNTSGAVIDESCE